MANINEVLAAVTLILQIQNGQAVGSATGFFYSKANNIYLVTNRHVVLDDDKKLRPEALRIRLHSNRDDLTKNVDFDIPLYAEGVPKWHVHPNYNAKKIDIAVIEIDQKKLKPEYFFLALNAGHFVPEEYDISSGEDVMIVGYPRGFSDSIHNLPVIRKAMIASAYGIHFQGNPFFLVDANLHPGMSGSPVVTATWTVRPNKKGELKYFNQPVIFLLGIHSATFGIQLPSGQEPLGLGTVWYGYLIEQIIDGFVKR